LDNPISWNYLSTVPGPNEVFGPLAIMYLAVFVVGFIVALILYNNHGRALFSNPVMFRMFRKWSGWALVVFGAGLFFFLIRALQINPFTFAMRFWMWVTVMGIAALVVMLGIDFRRHYARQLAQWEARKEREKYLKPLSSVAGRHQAKAALATTSRPVKRRRR
jgi:phosphoglycerol transferase MdoB-like AlkP superfamily enzyme